MAFEIEFSLDAEDHLRALSARERSIVLHAIEEQLVHQPDFETRNRKPMRPNPVAPWELRAGDLRIYYDVVYEPTRTVLILAVGVKIGNTVRIGGREVEL